MSMNARLRRGVSELPQRWPIKGKRALNGAAGVVALCLACILQVSTAQAAPSEVVVESTENLAWGEPFHEVREIRCPTGTYVTDTPYHADQPGWYVPDGLEVIQGASGGIFDVDIHAILEKPTYDSPRVGVAGFGSTVSNWFGPAQTVTFRLHCQ